MMRPVRSVITSSDIARLAGVSRQAVSSVLTGRGNSKVCAVKHAEILRLAEELGYKSNVSALSLAGHRTYTIGLVSSWHGIIGAINRLIAEKIRASGYELLQVVQDSNQDGSNFPELISRGAEGIISSYKPSYDRGRVGVPVLQLGYDGCDVDIDYEETGLLVARHLLRHGHRKVLIVNSLQEITNGRWKYASLQETLQGKAEVRNLCLFRNPDGNSQVLAAIKDGFTGIFCAYDHIAWRLLTFLRQHGYRAPDDFAVIGFGGHVYNEYMNPTLTSVIYPVQELAELAVKHMIEKIVTGNHEKLQKPILVKPKLNPGRSCGCPERPLKCIFWEGNFTSVESAYQYLEQAPETLQDQYSLLTEE
ncbi:MAG: LacI family DNA-binding transcriptional regulator [Lentisphaeria bacterium]|nr:LacI family DNA-binding transcriptional regulator [Lentisphaeria bacterium]